MRRLSFNRPKEKLRGIKRRLKSIDSWANSFEGYFPSEYSQDKYWNCKIPILDRMVNQPTTTKELQAHCAKAMLRAAYLINKAKPSSHNQSIVTVLLTSPDMFSSEICVFFDTDHFKSFYTRDSKHEKLIPISNKSLLNELNIEVNNGFNESGFKYLSREEWDGEIISFEQEWWSYRAIHG